MIDISPIFSDRLECCCGFLNCCTLQYSFLTRKVFLRPLISLNKQNFWHLLSVPIFETLGNGQSSCVKFDEFVTIIYSTVQYSTVQYSTVQYSTVQYSTVQYSTVQYIVRTNKSEAVVVKVAKMPVVSIGWIGSLAVWWKIAKVLLEEG
jgi:hypothetical protein